MKFIVTILLLSIQAGPSYAKAPKWLRQLAEPAIDYFFGDDEEEKELPNGRLQTPRIEGMTPNDEMQVFKVPKDYNPLELRWQSISPSHQEAISLKIITLAPGRSFYHHNHGAILNTIVRERIPGMKKSQDEDYKGIFARDFVMHSFREQTSLNNLIKHYEINHKAISKKQQGNPWEILLRAGKEASFPRTKQSSSSFLDYSQDASASPLNDLLEDYWKTDSISFMLDSVGIDDHLCTLMESEINGRGCALSDTFTYDGTF